MEYNSINFRLTHDIAKTTFEGVRVQNILIRAYRWFTMKLIYHDTHNELKEVWNHLAFNSLTHTCLFTWQSIRASAPFNFSQCVFWSMRPMSVHAVGKQRVADQQLASFGLRATCRLDEFLIALLQASGLMAGWLAGSSLKLNERRCLPIT